MHVSVLVFSTRCFLNVLWRRASVTLPSMHKNLFTCLILTFFLHTAGLVVQEPVRGSRSHTVDLWVSYAGFGVAVHYQVLDTTKSVISAITNFMPAPAPVILLLALFSVVTHFTASC